MADAWKIEFGSTTLLTASEGVYQFTHGMFKRILTPKKMPYGCYDYLFDGGYTGAEHDLQLTFLTTNRTMSTYISRMQGVFNGTIATLKVPDYPNMANCVITDIAEGAQTAIQNVFPLNAASTAQTGGEDKFFVDGFKMDFTLKFRQLRP